MHFVLIVLVLVLCIVFLNCVLMKDGRGKCTSTCGRRREQSFCLAKCTKALLLTKSDNPVSVPKLCTYEIWFASAPDECTVLMVGQVHQG